MLWQYPPLPPLFAFVAQYRLLNIRKVPLNCFHLLYKQAQTNIRGLATAVQKVDAVRTDVK